MSVESNLNCDLYSSLNHRSMGCANIGIGGHCLILGFLNREYLSECNYGLIHS